MSDPLVRGSETLDGWPDPSTLTGPFRDAYEAAQKVFRNYMEAEALAGLYRAALEEIAQRPVVERNPDGVDQAAYTMQLIAREALEGPDA